MAAVDFGQKNAGLYLIVPSFNVAFFVLNVLYAVFLDI